jgi:PhnB protein
MPDQERMERLDRAIASVLAGNVRAAAGDPEVERLAEVAAILRDLPAEDFKVRLKDELQRRATMSLSTPTAVGFRTVTPFLIHAQAPELVEFLKATFGAEELKRNTAGEAYGFYSEVRIGDSLLMIGGGTAAQHGNLPSALHVYVDDCDAAYRRAKEAGAVTLMGAQGEPADRPYGERSAFVQDTFGNYWYIATRLGPAPEGAASLLPYLHPERARPYIDFLKRAFGAEEMGVYEHEGRVMHAVLRMGDATLEMGEPEDRTGIPVNGAFLFVDDVDTAYARALDAGAATVRPPDDIPYGMRSAIVRDPAGYLWWTAKRP